VDLACRRWRCTIEGEPTHGQVALVVPLRHPAGPAVLKVSFPHPGNLGEADALRTFAGRGAVTLLEVDETGLVLVLERALPQILADHVARGDCPVEEAIEIAGDLANRLSVAPCRASPRWRKPRGAGESSWTTRSPRIPAHYLAGRLTEPAKRSSTSPPTRQRPCCTVTSTSGISFAAAANAG
jgi:streptomycin 6-kinase